MNIFDSLHIVNRSISSVAALSCMYGRDSFILKLKEYQNLERDVYVVYSYRRGWGRGIVHGTQANAS